MLCAYFKAGVCEKGKRCKFSHDLALDGKASKIDIYSDPRDKSGKIDPARTDITCQHFLEAVEKNLYGWLWECPNNSDKCQYRHSLPAGFILQRDKKDLDAAALADLEDDITIEEKIEEERAALPSITVWSREKGLPIVMTQSPTINASELPIVATLSRSRATILKTAMSLAGSDKTSFPGNWRPSDSRT